MNNNESLRTILELQGIIRNLGIPHGDVFAYQEQLQNIGTIVKSPLTEYVRKNYPDKSCIQNQFNVPQFGVLAEAYSHLSVVTDAIRRVERIDSVPLGSETIRAIAASKPAISELSSCIQEIKYKNSNIYIPEILIPDDYVFNKEPENIECDNPVVKSSNPKIKKISPLDAYNIIYGLIMLLLAVITVLQSQMGPSKEQLQEVIETQKENNELLQKNNEILQLELDATLKTVDYLSTILSEIQISVEDNQELPEPPLNADSDSQAINSNPSEFRSENPTFLDESTVPDKH